MEILLFDRNDEYCVVVMTSCSDIEDHDNHEEVEIPWIEDGTSQRLPGGGNGTASGDDDDENDEEEGGENFGADMFGADTEPYSEFFLRLGCEDGDGDDDEDDGDENKGPVSSVLGEQPKQNDDEGFQEHSRRRLPPPITMTLRGKKPRMPQFLTSTGLTLWEGSRTLAHYLYYNTDVWMNDNRRWRTTTTTMTAADQTGSVISVVELGAGLGVCGIVAYSILMSHISCIASNSSWTDCHRPSSSQEPNIVPYVILTDGDTATLQNMRENVRLNVNTGRLPQKNSALKDDSMIQQQPSPRIICKQLLWGSDFVPAFRKQYGPAATSRNNNKRGVDGETAEDVNQENKDDDDDNRFDIVMAADVVYGVENLQPLMETVVGLLRSGNIESRSGIFILSYVFRTVPIKMVIKCAQDHGMTCVERPPPSSQDPDASEINTNGVYIFRWAV
jgi:hypothetical protein